jgi:hypothetical protein
MTALVHGKNDEMNERKEFFQCSVVFRKLQTLMKLMGFFFCPVLWLWLYPNHYNPAMKCFFAFSLNCDHYCSTRYNDGFCSVSLELPRFFALRNGAKSFQQVWPFTLLLSFAPTIIIIETFFDQAILNGGVFASVRARYY